MGDGRGLQPARSPKGWEGLIVEGGARAVSVRTAQPELAQAETRCTNRNSSSADGPSRGRRGSTSARCCSAYVETGRRWLKYVGHTGTGFNEAELARVWKLLKAREIRAVAVLVAQSRPTNRRTGSGPIWWRR